MSKEETKELTVADSERELNASEKSMVDVEAARAIAQIQGSMTLAKKFPRDENAAIARMRAAAKRRRLAESAQYEYKRGGQAVAGPSIRAAETIAQAWGNMDMGVTEIRRDTVKRESLAMAHAVDLETNTWKRITFFVPHQIDTSNGPKHLTSSRDIYERVMNDGARRLRNCILATVPSDVVDEFMDECERTMMTNEKPLKDRIGVTLQALEQHGVTKPMVEATYGCKAEAITERQFAQLGRIYHSLKDGFGQVADYFKMPSTDTKAANLNEKMKQAAGKKVETKEPALPKPKQEPKAPEAPATEIPPHDPEWDKQDDLPL